LRTEITTSKLALTNHCLLRESSKGENAQLPQITLSKSSGKTEERKDLGCGSFKRNLRGCSKPAGDWASRLVGRGDGTLYSLVRDDEKTLYSIMGKKRVVERPLPVSGVGRRLKALPMVSKGVSENAEKKPAVSRSASYDTTQIFYTRKKYEGKM